MIAGPAAPAYRCATLSLDPSLLIALVALQFGVHALGWAMATALSRGWGNAEAQFAAFWLLAALGLLLYVPAWESGSAPRNLASLMLVGAALLQHRGMVLHWGGLPPDRRYALALLAAALAVLLSTVLERGHGLRVATVALAGGVMLLASMHLLWTQGRVAAPRFAGVAAAGHGLLALLLLARAVQALGTPVGVKIAIDAPGHGNLALVMAVLVTGGLINLVQIQLVLGRMLRRLQWQAQTDELTGTVNRRGLLQQLEVVHQRATGSGHGYAVLMVDVDHFKAVNDRLGHAEGDRVLQHVARSLRDALRTGDVVARWGGEEFCVLLPRVNAAEAQALAVRMAARIAASGEPRVTVSVGVAEALAHWETAEDVIRRADAALYSAKQAGRNRVVTAPSVRAVAPPSGQAVQVA